MHELKNIFPPGGEETLVESAPSESPFLGTKATFLNTYRSVSSLSH